ncbi:hypothetical protein BDV98DRAFT_573879 [Pterulicium gracile]|uniref:DUF6534 domain-containing protein n=1 Tax=Pterulicium gracile TaxID=1884261 RepID=A0A5C3Q9I4_9AGAR|nr:hypothetical protein BDV98DRAFT_573879 [Pterula gracilis]
MSPTFDTSIGVLMISGWCNAMLYTLEVSQACVYYRHYSRSDPRLIRAMVGVCLLFDCVTLCTEFASVYLHTVTHWGIEVPYLQGQPSLVSLIIASTAIPTLVVHLFLIRRFCQLGRTCNNILKSISSLMIISAILTILASVSVSAMVLLGLFKTNASRLEGKILEVAIVLRMCLIVFTDWFIALSLIYKLRQLEPRSKSSSGTVRRITCMTIQTGAVTSLLVLVSLILYITSRDTWLAKALSYCVGTTYSLSMLDTLNRRHELAGTRSHAHGCSSWHDAESHEDAS